MTMSNGYPLDISPPHILTRKTSTDAYADRVQMSHMSASLLLFLLFSFFVVFVCDAGMTLSMDTHCPCTHPFTQGVHRSSSPFSFFSPFLFLLCLLPHSHPSHPFFLLSFPIRTTAVWSCCSSLFLFLYSLVSSLPPALFHFSTLSTLFIS